MPSCSVCDKYFSKTFNLNRHLQKIHSVEGAVKKRVYKTVAVSSAGSGSGSDSTAESAITASDSSASGVDSPSSKNPKSKIQKHHVCCDNVYSPEEYKIHLKNHFYKCPICHFKTLHKSSLNQHYRSHLSTKRILCKDCGKSFKSMKSFNFHVKSIHLGKSKIYECGCGYKTIHKSTFRRHSEKCTGTESIPGSRGGIANTAVASKEIATGEDMKNSTNPEEMTTAEQSKAIPFATKMMPKSPTEMSTSFMSDEQTLFSQDEADHSTQDHCCLQPQSLHQNQLQPAHGLQPHQDQPQESLVPANQNQSPSLVEWITGYNHPRTIKSESRKFSCHVPNCFLTFTRFYDFKRHFNAVHGK